MKRITVLLILVLALVLVACGGEPQTARTAGTWQGSLKTGVISTPITFTVDARGKVQDSSFNLSYEDLDLSYSVTSRTTAATLEVTAQADSPLGSLTYSLTGTVQGDVMEGSYTLSIKPADSPETKVSGSLHATRR